MKNNTKAEAAPVNGRHIPQVLAQIQTVQGVLNNAGLHLGYYEAHAVSSADCYQAARLLTATHASMIDLLAALKACFESLRVIADGAGDVPDWNEGGEYYEACEQARAAIARAEGR